VLQWVFSEHGWLKYIYIYIYINMFLSILKSYEGAVHRWVPRPRMNRVYYPAVHCHGVNTDGIGGTGCRGDIRCRKMISTRESKSFTTRSFKWLQQDVRLTITEWDTSAASLYSHSILIYFPFVSGIKKISVCVNQPGSPPPPLFFKWWFPVIVRYIIPW